MASERIQKRDQKIFNDYESRFHPDLKKGAIVREIALKYGLMESTVKRVVYDFNKKRKAEFLEAMNNQNEKAEK